MRKLLTGLAAGLSFGGTALGQSGVFHGPRISRYCPPMIPVCPPAPVVPDQFEPTPPFPPSGVPTPPGSTPNVPPTPGTTGQPPVAPEVAPPPSPSPATDSDTPRQFSRATPGGGDDIPRRNVNMVADLLGARSLAVTYTVPITARFGVLSPATTANGGSAFRIDPNANGSFIQFGPTPNGATARANASFANRDLTYVQPTSGPGIATFDRAFAQAALQSLLSTGQLTAAQVLAFNQLSPADRDQLLANRGAINALIAKATNGLSVANLTVSSVGGKISGGSLEYTALLSGTQTVSLPGASSTVGRVKMSEDNSPLPRDRVIFNYDSFGDVPFTNQGMNVNRFQFGIEKTFLDGRWSAEVRLPFAGTLASTYTQGAEVKDVEFGNLRLAVKRILTQNSAWLISTGMAVSLPTAKDQTVLSSIDGSTLYRFRNQSVQLEPFIGALFTPTERLFAQLWGSINFDASGSDLTWNPAVFDGSGSARVWDLPILSVDGQIGYWVIQNGRGTLRGLAPFAELHWNQTIAQSQAVNAVGNTANGLGLTFTAYGSQELNLTTGLLTQIGDNLNLSLAAAVPLLQRPDRTFNWQIGLRASYFFGRTARNLTPMVMATNY